MMIGNQANLYHCIYEPKRSLCALCITASFAGSYDFYFDGIYKITG